MFENFGSGHGLDSSKHNRGAAVEAYVIGEQQLKQTQSGSSSRSGRDGEQQLKRMQAASSRRNRGAAAEAKGEQQLKWMPQSGPGAAAEADAIGEQLCLQSAQRAVRWRITHGR